MTSSLGSSLEVCAEEIKYTLFQMIYTFYLFFVAYLELHIRRYLLEVVDWTWYSDNFWCLSSSYFLQENCHAHRCVSKAAFKNCVTMDDWITGKQVAQLGQLYSFLLILELEHSNVGQLCMLDIEGHANSVFWDWGSLWAMTLGQHTLKDKLRDLVLGTQQDN